MNYTTLKQKQSKELGEFKGMFFAFNDEQFNAGMEKIGVEKTDYQKIINIGNGGFMLKSQRDNFNKMNNRHSQELKEQLKDENFLLNALVYELNNYEYSITGEVDKAIEALGLKKEEIDSKVLDKAKKEIDRNFKE